ncbi:MAG: hypothetical protein ACT4NY_00705 [Pseudonocardiales bacterium]
MTKPWSPLLFGFADQTLASVAEATRVRTLIGGDPPWHRGRAFASLLVWITVLGAPGISVHRAVMAGWQRPGHLHCTCTCPGSTA